MIDRSLHINLIPTFIMNLNASTTLSTNDPSIANFMNAIHPLSKKALAFICDNSYTAFFPEKSFLVKPAYNHDQLFLIKKGVVRGFMKYGKREITTWINKEGELVAPIRSLGLGICSEEYLQALEDCEVTGISYKAIEFLYENFPISNRIGRILLEDSYRSAEERAFLCRISAAGKRYSRFMESKADLVNRISLKYIASYLNMSLETLSRFRNRKETKNL